MNVVMQRLILSLFFNQALSYRPFGDYNPLHSDPDIAQLAGYASSECYSIIVFIVIFDIEEVFGVDVGLRSLSVSSFQPLLS